VQNSPLRYCSANPHCPNKVRSGSCSACKQAQPSRKESAHARGYTRQWERFRTITFPNLLLDQGIPSICGARLAPGPSPHSQCSKAGVVTMQGLELDHDPPLSMEERSQPSKVLDPWRVQYLCKRCHAVKTNKERRERAA
jgi:5-methylcytosine-specific restriction endonuclease McrA